MIVSVTTLSNGIKRYYAECRIFIVTLSVVMMDVGMMSVIAPTENQQ
jgi:hypothetical protein